MGIESVRSAFIHAAQGKLQLDRAGLDYVPNGQTLSFTGWHVDGAPFAMVTAPFAGFVTDRAARAALDIIQAHTGAPTKDRAMSKSGSGLARLMGGMKGLDDKANQLAERLETAMGGITTEMATTEQIVSNVETSLTDLQGMNRLYSNGDEAVPTSGGSSAASDKQPTT